MTGLQGTDHIWLELCSGRFLLSLQEKAKCAETVYSLTFSPAQLPFLALEAKVVCSRQKLIVIITFAFAMVIRAVD